MANALYDKGRENFLEGNISWNIDDIKLLLHDENDDVVNLATDETLADISEEARVAISDNLTAKTTVDGVADAADVTMFSVFGDQFESIDIYKDTGTDSTSLLICNIDTATGLPLTPNGGNIVIKWDDGVNRIFKL